MSSLCMQPYKLFILTVRYFQISCFMQPISLRSSLWLVLVDGAKMPSWFDIHEISVTAARKFSTSFQIGLS